MGVARARASEHEPHYFWSYLAASAGSLVAKVKGGGGLCYAATNGTRYAEGPSKLMKPPDKAEKGTRFGCGFLFGLALVGVSSLWWGLYDRNLYVVTTLSVALVFGFAALRFGDGFWRWIGRWFWWFP